MYKNTYFLIIVVVLNSCTSTIIQYGLYSINKPEWMLNYEFSRNYLGLQYGEHYKEHYIIG